MPWPGRVTLRGKTAKGVARYDAGVSLAKVLTEALVRRPDVLAAWLYGSEARGSARASSDVDVAVLLAEPPAPGLEGCRFDLAGDLTEACGRVVDLVVLDRASADLVHRVLRDGVLLVERDRSRRIAFETRRRAEYLDLAPVRRAVRRLAVRP